MMSHRIVRQLGWVLWLLDAARDCCWYYHGRAVSGSNENGAMLGTFAMVTAFFAFPTIGALIIWRRPWNTVGWIFCAIGLGTAFTSFSAAFVQYALGKHTDTSFIVGLVDALGNTVWPMNLGLGTFLLFLFPTGRLLIAALAVCLLARCLPDVTVSGYISADAWIYGAWEIWRSGMEPAGNRRRWPRYSMRYMGSEAPFCFLRACICSVHHCALCQVP